MSASDALEHRDGLPEPLRVLLEEYPKEAWADHDNFSALIRFWLDRHIMFRRLIETLTSEAEVALDGNMAPDVFAKHLSRYGGMFLNELHMHHTIEDTQYFPKLIGLDRRISRGFDILDNDHKAIDGHLAAFAEDANAVLSTFRTSDGLDQRIATLHSRLGRMEGFLNRHLEDEEELVVPVLLAHAPNGMV